MGSFLQDLSMAYLYRQIQMESREKLDNSISLSTFVCPTHPNPLFLVSEILDLSHQKKFP